MSLRVVVIDYGYVRGPRAPADLLREMPVLAAWNAAVYAAGRDTIDVVQRFHRSAELQLGGVRYLFRGRAPRTALLDE